MKQTGPGSNGHATLLHFVRKPTAASLGMLAQSPRGRRRCQLWGRSGRRLRLNWLAKKRLRKTRSHCRSSSGCRPSRNRRAREEEIFSGPELGGSDRGRNRPVRTGRLSTRSPAIWPSHRSATVPAKSRWRPTSKRAARSPSNSCSAALHQEPHQRLRNADVRVVHAHVVGVVGRPAKRRIRGRRCRSRTGVHKQAGAGAGLDVSNEVVAALRWQVPELFGEGNRPSRPRV